MTAAVAAHPVEARPADAVVVTSASWGDGPTPTVAALVSTYRRPEFLAELVACLEQQDLPAAEYEVVLVDNGSADDATWARLADLVAASPARVLALRLVANHGPAPGRNGGARQVRAPVFAITDDDCLPTSGWLRAMRDAFADDAVEVIQGRVHADPVHRDAMGPWDHTIWVTAPTPFFETCNVGYRRSAYERVGGFDETDPLLHPPSGRAFGEDACLAWEVQRTGGASAFVEGSVVHHRCIPGTYARWLADQRELVGFPGLARRSPLVARWLFGGVFLDRRSAAFDLAVLGVVAAVLTRHRWLAVTALPWARLRWRFARHLARGDRRDTASIAARLAWSDSVALAAMAKGSVKHRRILL